MDLFKDKISKAVELHSKIDDCVSQEDKNQAEFLNRVNSIPELAYLVTGIRARADKNGIYKKLPNGELQGSDLYPIDPGLKNLAKRHFDGTRIECRKK